ncbi:MAG TPA: hypothetical protein PKX10_00395, partial [Propioniciclava tarda]|nr:hypothetical protein [Propioniciclava tarda]
MSLATLTSLDCAPTPAAAPVAFVEDDDAAAAVPLATEVVGPVVEPAPADAAAEAGAEGDDAPPGWGADASALATTFSSNARQPVTCAAVGP